MKWILRTTEPGVELKEQKLSAITILEAELTMADLSDLLKDRVKSSRIRIDDQIFECGVRLSSRE